MEVLKRYPNRWLTVVYNNRTLLQMRKSIDGFGINFILPVRF